METVRKPGCGIDVKIPADGICAIRFKCFERIYRISFGLTHLLTVLILYMSENDNIFIRSLVKQKRGLRKKGIEPSTGLVHCLGNKLCRELLLKHILILKRIMMLCKRHCTGIKPAVDYFGHTMHLLAAVRAGDNDRIDVRTVKFHFCIVRIAG